MRKLLLAATAVVGAMGLASAAHAQAAQSGYILGPDPTIFGPTSSVPGPTGLPGSMQVYFRGRLHTDWMVGGDSLDHGGGNKSGNIMFGEYARIYTGFEGVAANGLNFGAFVEVRQNGSSSLGASTGNNTLIFRREVGYLKGSWGQVRFGETDGASGLFQTGNFENFDDGGWNGDLPGLFSGNAQLDWPFPENSGTYGTGKIVYLSPQFAGFDFGVDYEPNFNNTGEANCTSAATGGAGGGCPRLSSITGPFGSQARRNTFDLTGRYQGTLGPVALTGMVGVMTAGHVNNAAQGASNPTNVQIGATIAFGGFAIGGDVIGGNSNGTGYAALVPVGDGGARELGFVVGTSYAFGPFIVGASYLHYHSQGAYVNTAGVSAPANHNYSSRSQTGVAVGGTYAWAPGTSAFLSFLWGERHQVGYDFATAGAGLGSNNTSAVGALIGNTFNW
jgi:Gram-negative porin